MATLELKRIRKTYDATEVIGSVDLKIDDGEFVVFVGPSGCGKSTLLRMIAGLEEISAGDLLIDGVRANDIPPDRRGLAMVFQSYALYPHMTVADNMGFALRLQGVPKRLRDEKVARAAKILEIEPLLDRKPGQLSGGQRQRVAIGRSIVREPKVFLFDEPLSNLDAALRVQMRLEIAKLHRELCGTTIYVTHDQVEAMTLADRIVVMRGGHIEQVGTPLELYHRPANRFVAGFIGSPKMNFLPASVQAVVDQEATLALAGGGRAVANAGAEIIGKELTVGVRPEHLLLSARGSISGCVRMVEHLGNGTLAYVDIGAPCHVTVNTAADSGIQIGEVVHLEIKPGSVSLFDAEGRALPQASRSIPFRSRSMAAGVALRAIATEHGPTT